MKKLFCSIVGTVVVAAFLVVASPMYARGGHGGHRGGHGGHAVRHAAAGHVKGGHGGFRVRGGRGHNFARHARGFGRYTGRTYAWNRGRAWRGYYGYPYYGNSGYSLGYYGLGYSYPYYGYYPYEYYPYRYGYWPSVSFWFGGY